MRETSQSLSPLEQQQKQTSGLFRDCTRFIPKRNFAQQNQDNATVFAKLRRAGLPKQKALQYCQTQHCKLDTTQTKFGPPGYKIFKQNFDDIKQYNGWQLEGKIRLREQCEYQKICQDHNFGLKQQPSEDLYQLYNKIAETHRKTEERCNFTDLSRNELITKLRSLTRDENRKYNTPLYQLRRHNEIYYELADYFEKQQPPQHQSLVQELEAFDDIVPKKQLKQFYLEQKTGTKKKNFGQEVSDKIQRRSRILMELTALFTPTNRQQDTPNRHSFYQKQDQMWQVQNDSAITSLLDMDESNIRSAQRNSILLFRPLQKIRQNEEQKRNEKFQESLQQIVKSNIDKLNGIKSVNKKKIINDFT